ncbi:MAG: leucine--tRNA ligase [Candidatus Levybacteria bacterium]|nr:leucine--tRNA ligase [Candidatus Levybacteria bacterium]
MKNKYDYLELQKKWEKKWKNAKIYQPDLDSAKKPYYVLYMFPYPSAEGLHVGHAFSGTGADVYARFMRMKGYDVFHPMGFDAFGIHSENYALKINDHPKNLIDRATKHFRQQFDSLGFSYDWSHTVNTSSPDYYKWTQWLFIQLFKAGLAEKKKALVNWCPSCKTVLADEQVVSGKNVGMTHHSVYARDEDERLRVCERCGTAVEYRELEQWFFKITKYADRLLEGLDRIDWTEKVKLAQRNWIGRKEGSLIRFSVLGSQFSANSQSASLLTGQLKTDQPNSDNRQQKTDTPEFIEVFTTRPDTNFGATFIALAPEHRLALKLTTPQNKDKVSKYIERSKKKTEQERMEEGREKTGIFSGSYAINDLTGEKMPIWISDFVLMEFGTGAVVGVPGHDKRDFQFAQKFGLPIKRVVVGKDGDTSPIASIEQVQEEEGKMINSGFLNGLDIKDAIKAMMDHLEAKGFGKREVTYHLRDWLISRQRYWGAPIPMVYCSNCANRGDSWFTTSKPKSHHREISNFKFQISNSAHKMRGWFPVPEEDLPVVLPYIENFKPLGTGVAPLAQDKKFVNTKCPVCHGPAKRETDVCDTFLDSAWYFLRYLATESDKIPFPSKAFASENSENSDIQRQSDSQTIRQSDSTEFSESSGMVKRTRFLPINMYIGGAEHSVLHLLYSRFVTKVLFDLKFLDFDEPFTKFRAHGLLIKDGAKMSKSRGNVVNPDNYIQRFGSDTLRCYLMFIGPFSQGGDFRDSGMEGMERFLKRVRKLIESNLASAIGQPQAKKNQSDKSSAKFSANSKIEKSINRAIKRVGEDVENLRYNTALAKIMELVNDLNESKANIAPKHLKTFVILLAPFAPYLSEELWEKLQSSVFSSQFSESGKSFDQLTGKQKTVKPKSDNRQQRTDNRSVHLQPWPSFDESSLSEEEATVAVQVNGRLRSQLTIDSSQLTNKELVKQKARNDQKVSKYLKGQQVRKVIYVPGKIINFVV